MNVNYTPINFNAKFISPAALKECGQNKIKDVDASIVMFDNTNKRDLRAVKYIATRWIKSFYTNDLYATALNKADGMYPEKNIYFITKQTCDFENLIPNLITGYMKVISKGKNEVYIDTIERKHTYYGMGTGYNFIQMLKNLYRTIVLYSRDDKDTKNFYINNDFQLIDTYLNKFKWQKQ